MLTLDSKVKALKKSPEATAIIVKYSPGFATDPQMTTTPKPYHKRPQAIA